MFSLKILQWDDRLSGSSEQVRAGVGNIRTTGSMSHGPGGLCLCPSQFQAASSCASTTAASPYAPTSGLMHAWQFILLLLPTVSFCSAAQVQLPALGEMSAMGPVHRVDYALRPSIIPFPAPHPGLPALSNQPSCTGIEVWCHPLPALPIEIGLQHPGSSPYHPLNWNWSLGAWNHLLPDPYTRIQPWGPVLPMCAGIGQCHLDLHAGLRHLIQCASNGSS